MTMEQQPTEVWGIAVMAPKQRPAAEKHCFGDCGKISMAGAINDDLTGGLFVCCQATCPYEAEVMPNYGSTMSFGKPHTAHLRLAGSTEESKPTDARTFPTYHGPSRALK